MSADTEILASYNRLLAAHKAEAAAYAAINNAYEIEDVDAETWNAREALMSSEPETAMGAAVKALALVADQASGAVDAIEALRLLAADLARLAGLAEPECLEDVA